MDPKNHEDERVIPPSSSPLTPLSDSEILSPSQSDQQIFTDVEHTLPLSNGNIVDNAIPGIEAISDDDEKLNEQAIEHTSITTSQVSISIAKFSQDPVLEELEKDDLQFGQTFLHAENQTLSSTTSATNGTDADIQAKGNSESERDNVQVQVQVGLATPASSAQSLSGHYVTEDPFSDDKNTAGNKHDLKDNPFDTDHAASAVHAAKRRRTSMLHSSQKQLRKPFKSPVKIDQPQPKQILSSLPPKTPEKSDEDQITSQEEPASPDTDPENAEDYKQIQHKPIFSTPISLPRNTNPRFKSSFAATSTGSPFKLASTRPALSPYNKPKDPELQALQQQHTRLLMSLKEAKAAFDNATQALKIEKSGEDERLENLIVKWRGASQSAADAVFEKAAERAQKQGGVETGPRSQNWGYMDINSGNWGFADGDGEVDSEEMKERKRMVQEEYEAEYGGYEERNREEQAQKQLSGNDEFTMDMLLKTLNIDPSVIAYDKDQQRWIT